MNISDYSTLKAEQIVLTTEKLITRIEARFPHSGLLSVSKEVLEVGKLSRREAIFAAKPILWIRAVSFFMIFLIIAGVIGGILSLDVSLKEFDFFNVVQTLEAAINEVVLIGLVVVFLAGLETRMKRARVRKTLFRLRSLAHIIDMHQLTKDPEKLLKRGVITSVSPKTGMNEFELERYFDYCSELLALIAKYAALFSESFNDATVTAASNEIEVLCTALSRKIWQKIMILYYNRGEGQVVENN